MTNPDLDIHVSEMENAAIFEVVGSVVSSEDFLAIADELNENELPNAIVILDEVDYINSAGFSGLIILSDTVSEYGKSLYIVGLRKKVQIVFDSLGASSMLNIFPTLKLALSHIDAR